MEATGATTKGKKRSENRERQEQLNVRFTPAEREQLEALADRARLSLAGYIRTKALEEATEKPTTRARRRPTIEVHTVSALLGQLSKIGSNLNQIAKRANSGDRPLLLELGDTLAACRKVADRAKDVLDGNT